MINIIDITKNINIQKMVNKYHSSIFKISEIDYFGRTHNMFDLSAMLLIMMIKDNVTVNTSDDITVLLTEYEKKLETQKFIDRLVDLKFIELKK